MKKTFLLLMIFMLPFLVFPQSDTGGKKEKQKIFLDVSAGVSVPLGNYANDDPKKDGAGYAKTGFFIQANADWMGKHDFGLAFGLMYQNNARQDTAEKLFSNGGLMGPGSWSNIYIMAGPVFLKNVKKISIDAKLTAGFIISGSPAFGTTDPTSGIRDDGTGTGFAIGLNGGLGYALTKKLALKLTLGYLAGFPKNEKQYNATVIGIDPLTGQYIYSAPTDYSYKITVSTFNTGLGVIYKF